MEPPEHASSTLLLQPLPVRRDDLVKFTKQYFSNVIKALKTEWLSKHKLQFQEFYKHREEFCVSLDGILSLNDRIVVPPNLRNSILQDLRSCHLGVDKLKSLVRLTVWWPELNADISSFVSKCARCLFKKPSVKASSWTPWPLTYVMAKNPCRLLWSLLELVLCTYPD